MGKFTNPHFIICKLQLSNVNTSCGHKSPTVFEKGGIGHWGKDHVGCPMTAEMFFLEVTQI